MYKHHNPIPAVDIIIELEQGIVLIFRKNPPFGWALPGGTVAYGESLENAAIREALKETGLNIRLERQFHTYSDPLRDDRQHSITTVFIAKADGIPSVSDDAAEIMICTPNSLPERIGFDHRQILQDYYNKTY